MTAELLEETIRITRRTLDEAEQRYPGIRDQISQLLLVGGSSWMPAVAERLKQEFSWEPRLSDPDLAVAKGAALYAAGQTVRFVEADDERRGRPGRPPVTAAPGLARSRPGDRGGGAGGGQPDRRRRGAGPRSRPAHGRQRAAQGRRRQAGRHQQAAAGKTTPRPRPTSSTSSTPQTQLPCTAAHACRAAPFSTNQPAVEIEIWEQAGEVPERDLAANHRVDDAGLIEGLGRYALPAGSPINIDIRVDAEGTVHLRAVEPTSGHDLEMNVRISVLSEEQMDEAIEIHRGLTISTS